MNVQMVDTLEVLPNPKNRNDHPQDQILRLCEIIKYQGFRIPLIISNRSGLLVSGHGRLLAAKFLGMKQVPALYQDFESEEQEYAAGISDNSIAAWSEIDLKSINTEIGALGPDFNIDLLGIKDFVIEPADKIGDCDADEAPEIRPTDIQLGDIFQLGVHRLMCGDSTLRENVALLMNGEKADMVFTDPPYGIDLDPDRFANTEGTAESMNFMRKKRLVTKSQGSIENDDRPFDGSTLLNLFPKVKEVFIFGANNFCHTIPDYTKGSWVCWDRTGGAGNLDEMLGSSFELCWSKQRHKYQIARVVWKGVCGHSKKDDGDSKVHPSMKPVALAEWFFERWGKDALFIVDLYLGSGSTLIACEKTNRKCYGMEIDPQYVQVIIDRWQKFTNQKVVKIGNA